VKQPSKSTIDNCSGDGKMNVDNRQFKKNNVITYLIRNNSIE